MPPRTPPQGHLQEAEDNLDITDGKKFTPFPSDPNKHFHCHAVMRDKGKTKITKIRTAADKQITRKKLSRLATLRLAALTYYATTGNFPQRSDYFWTRECAFFGFWL